MQRVRGKREKLALSGISHKAKGKSVAYLAASNVPQTNRSFIGYRIGIRLIAKLIEERGVNEGVGNGGRA